MSEHSGEGAKAKLPIEVTLPDSVTLNAASLEAGVRLVQALVGGSEDLAEEAEVRGGPGSGGPTAQQASENMARQASGAIELLGTLMPPPEGAANWTEAIERIKL